MLEMHAQHLGMVAKTADFRWWGDRVEISVSIGTAQAEEGETLSGLLTRAQRKMLAVAVGSVPGPAPTRTGGQACSQS
jgi:hypothetical protein